MAPFGCRERRCAVQPDGAGTVAPLTFGAGVGGVGTDFVPVLVFIAIEPFCRALPGSFR